MTRKLLFITIAFFLLFTGCSGEEKGKPDKTSDRMYKLGIAALEAADEYLDGNIDGDEAEDRLDNTYMYAGFQIESDKEELGSDTLFGTKFANDELIYHDILLLQRTIFEKNHGTGTKSDIVDMRNSLAKRLGK